MRVAKTFTLLVLLLLPICYYFLLLSIQSSLGRFLSGISSSSSVLFSTAAAATTTTTTTKKDNSIHVKGEVVPIYDYLPQNNQTLPPHLTHIDPSTLIISQQEAVSIDIAHREGKLHIGHVLFVMDNKYNLLFLQRSKEVVTCPSTWSVLGEHANSNETPIESVLRAIQEELGLVRVLNYHDIVGGIIDEIHGEQRESNNNNSKKKNNDTLTEEGVYYFRSSKDVDMGTTTTTSSSLLLLPTTNSNIIRVTIQNITQYPLYYIRHYGPRNNNRIDSQLTYLWSVIVSTTTSSTTTTNGHQQAVDTTNYIQQLISLDAEVADYKWMNLIQAIEWLANDAKNMIMVDSNKNHHENIGDEDDADDGPDIGDFCHSTIRSLYEVGLNSILQRMSN